MQEGGAPQWAAVRQGGRALGGIENQLDVPVFQGIHDVRPALADLVYFLRRNAVLGQVTLGPRRSDNLEAELAQELGGRQDARLVDVLDRDEHGAGTRQARAAADLALGKRDLERVVEPD